jgi:hypothetical protein
LRRTFLILEVIFSFLHFNPFANRTRPPNPRLREKVAVLHTVRENVPGAAQEIKSVGVGKHGKRIKNRNLNEEGKKTLENLNRLKHAFAQKKYKLKKKKIN